MTLPTYQADVNNYLGAFFLLGANQTPFLNYIGGINGYKKVVGETFPLDVYTSLESAAQNVVTEANAVAGTGTAITYTRAQHTNYIQTMLRNIQVSYKKMSDRWKLAGIYYATPLDMVQAELDFQTEMNLRQLAVDMEFSCFQGTGVAPSANTTSVTTLGLVKTGSNGGIQTNRVNGGSGYLTKAMIDECVKDMADNGAPFNDPVMFCGSYQKAKISDLYGWAPVAASGTGLGGVAVESIETDFARIPVVFAPKALASTVVIAEMSEMKIAGWEVPGKGAIFVEPKAKTGASESYQLFAQLGLDYGEESHSGCIYGLLYS
jgi:hypothetical protein